MLHSVAARPNPVEPLIPLHRIIRPLGSGTDGLVWLADHLLIEHTVAIKVGRSSDVRMTSRFLQEAKMARSTPHEFLVGAQDLGLTLDGFPYYSMPVFNGSLRDLLSFRAEQISVISIAELTTMVLSVGLAVVHLHTHGIIHRDIKPGNILYREQINGKEWALADLGLASAPHIRGAGTHPYVAPELFEPDMMPSECTDLFSLATVIVEAMQCAGLDSHSALRIRSSLQSSLSTEPNRRPTNLSHTLFELVQTLSQLRQPAHEASA